MLVVLGILLAFVPAELLLRHKFKIKSDFYKGLNPAFAAEIHKELNSEGFRDKEHSLEKSPDLKRIITLGDSITAGWGVRFEENYPRRLECILNKRHKVEVINISKPGWNTVREVYELENFGLKYKPDIVILGYCLNDTERAETDRRTRRFRRITLYRKPTGIWSFLVKRFMFFRLIYKTKEDLRVRRAFIDYINYIYSDKYAGWKHTETAFYRLKELSIKNRFKVLVVIFPFLNYSFKSYPFKTAHKRVRQLCYKYSFAFLDLLPLYKKYSNYELMAEPGRDPHPNALAHKIAAEAIADFIEKMEVFE